MTKRNILPMAAAFLIAGCVSGPGDLTPEQQAAAIKMPTFMLGEVPDQDFEVIEELKAARCTGTVGRVAGTAEGAMEFLRQKAAIIGADAVVSVQCGKAPFVNNCWAAAECEGIAVRWK